MDENKMLFFSVMLVYEISTIGYLGNKNKFLKQLKMRPVNIYNRRL